MNAIKQNNDQIAKFLKVPKTAHDVIPLETLYPSGMGQRGNRYSMTYKFSDINYQTASEEEKESLFMQYANTINSFDPGGITQLTVFNRPISGKMLESQLLQLTGDGLDELRNEWNTMLKSKTEEASGIFQNKYLTITCARSNSAEAENYFSRSSTSMSGFSALGSDLEKLDARQRLKLLHDFFRPEDVDSEPPSLKELMQRGIDFKDYLVPNGFSFKKDYFEMGELYGSVMFLLNYPSFLSDAVVSDLADIPAQMMLTLTYLPVMPGEAVRESEKRLLGVETNIFKWRQKQNENKNWAATIPYQMELQRKEAKEFLDDLIARDQRMILATILLVVVADSLEELKELKDRILTVGQMHLCRFATANYQQLPALNSVLPLGVCDLDVWRTLTTESASIFMPFRVQDISHPGGSYYGINPLSRNLIMVDRFRLMNANCIILGVAGSGKSFRAKEEIVQTALTTDADILILDPEKEYSALIKELGGETIEISSTSKNHINVFDMVEGYTDVADLADSDLVTTYKSELLLSICDLILRDRILSGKEKSLIDRCTRGVTGNYVAFGYKGDPPTLVDFYSLLKSQPEEEAKQLALELELFVTGSLNFFSHQTSVDIKNRIISFDLQKVGEHLMPVGMLIVLDFVFNRLLRNAKAGKKTYVFVDEMHLFFDSENAAEYLISQWKRCRKYGGAYTGITQNVTDMLRSYKAQQLIANSEFLILLNQAGEDREKLAEILRISENEMKFISNREKGHGLLKVGASFVPFEDKYPSDTKLYRLMTTAPGEY